MYCKLLSVLMKYNKYGSLPKFKDDDKDEHKYEYKNKFQFKRKSRHKPLTRILIIIVLLLVAYLIYINFINKKDENYSQFIKLN
jgi:hypothetical protein